MSTQETLEDLKEDNELLLLQLHQVQEELEHYFLRYQELTEEKIAKASSGVEHSDDLDHFNLDARQFFQGDNWYHAETDGRWAGPEKTSNIKLPELGSGQYSISLTIVDAMSPDIIKGLKGSAFGQTISFNTPVDKKISEYPFKLTGTFDITNAKSGNNLLELTFPFVVSPADSGGDDDRSLAIRLQAIEISRTATTVSTQSHHADPIFKTPDAAVFLFSEDFECSNWYEVEDNGRWSGPALESSITLPMLEPGLYQCGLEVTDWMDDEILDSLIIKHGEKVLFTEQDRYKKPLLGKAQAPKRQAILSFELNIDQEHTTDLRFIMDKVISPAAWGRDDHRKLGIKINSIAIQNNQKRCQFLKQLSRTSFNKSHEPFTDNTVRKKLERSTQERDLLLKEKSSLVKMISELNIVLHEQTKLANNRNSCRYLHK